MERPAPGHAQQRERRLRLLPAVEPRRRGAARHGLLRLRRHRLGPGGQRQRLEPLQPLQHRGRPAGQL